MIRLVCWKEDLALERVRLLKKAGLKVDATPLRAGSSIGALKASPPELLLIDLDRLPSHGREVAVAVRTNKVLRYIPIVFAGGVEEKVAVIRAEMPDATFTSWAKVAPAIAKAIKNAPAVPVVPPSHVVRYAGTSLSKKLGFKENMRAAMVASEPGFLDLLGDLPEGATIEPRITKDTKLVLWFARASHEVASAFELASARMPEGCSIWLIYPKKAGKFSVDFNQNDVRLLGLDYNLVDYKICAVDADWSGMKFARRK